jgi:hypothetical protein
MVCISEEEHCEDSVYTLGEDFDDTTSKCKLENYDKRQLNKKWMNATQVAYLPASYGPDSMQQLSDEQRAHFKASHT